LITKLKRLSLLVLLGVIVCMIFASREAPTQLTNEVRPYLCQYQIASNDLTKWIDELEEYECRDCPLGFKRIDDNGEFSYGCLQFQMPTFKQYFTEYYPEAVNDVEGADWENWIHSCEMQKKLTYKMIEDDWDNWEHWKHSILVRGLSKPPSQ